MLNTIPSNEIYQRGPFPFATMSLVYGLELRTRRGILRSDPDPRAYLVTAVKVVSDWRAAVPLLRAGHDGHQTALVEHPVAGLPPSAPATACAARITDFQAESVTVETGCGQPALLVLAEAWYPGWTARIDDGPAVDCLPANAWMRAIPVPAGAHRVTFAFHSRFLLAGAALSLLALAVAFKLGRWERRTV
jgi:hypothetical protein